MGMLAYCLSFGSSKNAHGFCNWGSSRSSSRRLPLAPRACRVKMGLRVINPLWIANSSRPAATSVKFAPARRRQNTQPPGWRLNMSFATLWRGWRRLEKTIGTLESTCIVIFVLEDVFLFLKLCWDTNSNLWDIFAFFLESWLYEAKKKPKPAKEAEEKCQNGQWRGSRTQRLALCCLRSSTLRL